MSQEIRIEILKNAFVVEGHAAGEKQVKGSVQLEQGLKCSRLGYTTKAQVMKAVSDSLDVLIKERKKVPDTGYF